MYYRHYLFPGIFLVIGLLIYGCNGLETDISKKLDFSFPLFASDSVIAYSTSLIDIPGHDEIDDYVDYAVYPNAFTTNEVSYQITNVGLTNTTHQVDIEAFYRTPSLDTISLFQVSDVPLTPNVRTVVTVSQSNLSAISSLVNTQSTFIMIVEATGDTRMIEFTIDIFFDTTIAIDYDL